MQVRRIVGRDDACHQDLAQLRRRHRLPITDACGACSTHQGGAAGAGLVGCVHARVAYRQRQPQHFGQPAGPVQAQIDDRAVLHLVDRLPGQAAEPGHARLRQPHFRATGMHGVAKFMQGSHVCRLLAVSMHVKYIRHAWLWVGATPRRMKQRRPRGADLRVAGKVGHVGPTYACDTSGSAGATDKRMSTACSTASNVLSVGLPVGDSAR